MSTHTLKRLFVTNITLCFKEVFTHYGRFIITSLGLFFGVAALLSNLSFMRGMDRQLQNDLEEMGGLSIIKIHPVQPADIHEELAFQRSPGLSAPSIRALADSLSYVRRILPEGDMHWERLYSGTERTHAQVKAYGPVHRELYNYELEHGTWFTEADMQAARPVCLIGSRVVRRLWDRPAREVIGEELAFRNLRFTVIGIIASRSMHAQRARECLIPYSVYEKRFMGHSRIYDEIALQLTDPAMVDRASREIPPLLSSLHRGATDFELEINAEEIAQQQQAQTGLRILLLAIAIISLVIGAVSIMNIMFATIDDRIREIGIRKALGAKNADIFVQFISEAVLVCCVGGIPGLLAGVILQLLPDNTFPFTPVVTGYDFFVAFAFTLLTGLASGFAPSLQAARMHPIIALQH